MKKNPVNPIVPIQENCDKLVANIRKFELEKRCKPMNKGEYTTALEEKLLYSENGEWNISGSTHKNKAIIKRNRQGVSVLTTFLGFQYKGWEHPDGKVTIPAIIDSVNAYQFANIHNLGSYLERLDSESLNLLIGHEKSKTKVEHAEHKRALLLEYLESDDYESHEKHVPKNDSKE